MFYKLVVLSFVLFSMGCSPERTSPEAVTLPPKTPATVEPPVAQAEPAAPVAPKPAFSVQEWGLVSYVASGAASLRSGPSAAPKAEAAPAPAKLPVIKPSNVMARKPVIYLKPDATWSEATPISVAVQFAGAGMLREVWPTPNHGPQPPPSTSFVWAPLRITDKACSPGWAPSVDAAACTSLPDLSEGGECEGAQLESWVPQTSRCLDVHGMPAGALVYNGTPADTKPVLEQLSPGVWKNTSAHALGAVLIRHEGALYALNELAAGAQQSLKAQERPATRVEDALAWTRAQLGAQGLGAQESEDFMRAWTQTLSDQGSWQVFGFLSAQAIESIATLTITPTPSKITRVMAFTVSSPRAAAVEGASQRQPKPAERSRRFAIVRIGDVQVVGGLDKAIVKRVARLHINELRYCYEKTLQSEPELNGSMAVNFIISPRGAVLVAEASASTTKNSVLEGCVTNKVRRWMFPSLREGASAKVRLPLTFSR